MCSWITFDVCLLELRGFYDRKKLEWMGIQDTTLCAACGPPGGGRQVHAATYFAFKAGLSRGILLVPLKEAFQGGSRMLQLVLLPLKEAFKGGLLRRPSAL